MANFCTKCGTPIVDNQKFCNQCGALIGAARTSAASPNNPAGSAAPPARAVGAPAKTGGSALKIIQGLVAAQAVVSVLAIGSCFYIGYRIKQKAISIAESTRSTPGGSSTPELHLSEGGAGSKAAASATVDVPPYPDSTPTESGGELSAGLAGAASAQEYETPDSMDKVESFYKNRFGSKITFVENEGKVVFNYLSSQGMTTVTITRAEGAEKTKINIARIGR